MWKIVLRICDSRFTRNCSSSVLNKIANHAYKARVDWLNHFHSPWESEGYKVQNQNDQLRLSWNLIWASLEAVIIVEQETNKFMRTRGSKVNIECNLVEFTCEKRLVESDYEHNPLARFLSTVWPEIEPQYDINYAISLVSVMLLRATLVVRE